MNKEVSSVSVPKHADIHVRCSVCMEGAKAVMNTGFARWVTLPAGWWILLDCVGGAPYVRCPKCL